MLINNLDYLRKGFTFTKNGWIQSYGSHFVKPPIIYGNISSEIVAAIKEKRCGSPRSYNY